MIEKTHLAGRFRLPGIQRAPNIRLIPGTSSLEHLRLNLQAATLRIPSEVIADLDAIGRAPGTLMAGESEP